MEQHIQRKPLIIGNWKSNGDIKFIEEFSETLNDIEFNQKNLDVVIAPPMIHIQKLMENLSAKFFVGAQNVSEFRNGAYTSQVSAD